MITCSLRCGRIVLLAMTLGIACAGFALAGAPMSVDGQPGKVCAPAMSAAVSQPGLTPEGLKAPEPRPNVLCFYGTYEEWWKDDVVCRWRNSCDGPQYHGSCPNGFDYIQSEQVICWCH